MCSQKTKSSIHLHRAIHMSNKNAINTQHLQTYQSTATFTVSKFHKTAPVLSQDKMWKPLIQLPGVWYFVINDFKMFYWDLRKETWVWFGSVRVMSTHISSVNKADSWRNNAHCDQKRVNGKNFLYFEVHAK